MKLGQMASYLDQGLPEPVREALAQLQSDAPPMAAELARATVEESLGRRIDEALRRVGRRADRVGVDRPGAPGRHPRRPGRRGEGAVPRRRRGHPGRPRQRRPAVRRHRDAVPRPRSRPARRASSATRLAEELDYRLEAAQPAAVRRRLPRPPVHPRPRRRRRAAAPTGCSPPSWPTAPASTRSQATWSQDERDLAGETIYRFVFRQPLPAARLQRRPAPRQLPVPPGRPGDVPRLRAGEALRRRPTVEVLARMVESIVLDRDIAAYRQAIADAGFLPIDAPFSDEADRGATSGTSTTSSATTRPMTITPEWSSESVRRFFDAERAPRRDHEGRQRAAGLRHHPAHQPRPLRRARRAGRHRQLAAHRRGDLALRRGAAVDPAGRAGSGVGRQAVD